jgi:SAM-dependent methyltransferase
MNRTSPIGPDYLWLARQDRSQLYPVAHKFLRAVELAATSVPGDLVSRARRRCRLRLLKLRLKRFAYALGGQPMQSEKYDGRIATELRNIHDAAIVAGIDWMEHGPLTRIMEQCGSDKANGRHNYTLFYDFLFHDDRSRVERVFEMGIGRGRDGRPGASLKGWKDYFNRASVFGGDIEAKLLLEQDRIKTALVDQTNPEAVDRLFDSMGCQFDLIIDDGLHELDANRTFFERAFNRLKDGGLFIIEDIGTRLKERYKAFLSQHDAAIIDIPHRVNLGDNCIAVVVKS